MTATVDGTDLGDLSGHPVLPPAYRPGERVGERLPGDGPPDR